MSAGYGFFNIAFVKKDNSPDAEAAKRALAWAKENLDWYKDLDEESDPFELNGNCWETNYDNWSDGVDVKDTVPDNLDWLKEVCDAVQAEKAVGTLTDDFSESDADNNSHYVHVYEDSGVEELQEIHFNSMCDPMRENEDYYVISSDTYREYKAAFKNKESGEVVLCGDCHYDDEDEQQYICFDDDVCYSCDVHAGKISGRYSRDEDEDGGSESRVLAAAEGWEFVGFMTQPAFDTVALGKKTEYRVDYEGKVWCEEASDDDSADFSIEDGRLNHYDGNKASVTVPEGVTSIGSHIVGGALYFCESLKTFTVPASVKSISRDAFEYCSSLAEVRYGGTKAQWLFGLGGSRIVRSTVAVHCSDGDAKALSEDLAEIVIPDGVTEIGKDAFKDYKSLVSVTITGSVRKIGERAFSGCTSLASVSIAGGVTEIGIYAFHDCESLASVSLPDGVSKIGGDAFEGCTSLASVVIPWSVTEIGGSVFGGCTALADIRFAGTKEQWEKIAKGNHWSKGVPAEGIRCTDGMAGLPQFDIEDGKLKKYLGKASSVSIPEGVTEIGYGAFQGCTALASLVIPEGVTKIDFCAFKGCTALASVSIPGSVTEIGKSAFEGCTSLADITIPASVTKIGDSAFSGCTSLASVSIPEGVTEIGSWAFEGCNSLAAIRYAGSKEQWEKIEKGEHWNYHIPAESVQCTDGMAGIPQFEINDGTLKEYLGAASSVTIPEGVTEIFGDGYGRYKGAFQGCTSIASLVIPGSVQEIIGNAFMGCTSLKEVQFSGSKLQWFNMCRGVPVLNSAVAHCSDGDIHIVSEDASSVTIPGGVTRIGGIYGCKSLAEVRYGGTKAQWLFELAGFKNGVPETAAVHCSDGDAKPVGTDATEISIPEGITKISSSAFKGCTSLASVTIPEGVTEIGSSAFEGCTSLVSLVIPEGVTKIGDHAFDGCTSLASVSIPARVTEISSCVFDGCTSLASLVIPEGVTKIDFCAFLSCTSLASVSIPDSVTEIGNDAFKGCTSLASLVIPGSVTKIGSSVFDGCTSLASVSIPGSVTEIGSGMFRGCTALTSVSIAEGVTKIGGGAFGGCTALASVSIPDSVTEIGDDAFKGCTSLASVSIPEGVTKIGGFQGCTSLASVSIPEGVTKIYYSAFRGCTALTSVSIPGSVTEICDNAFRDCTSLAEICFAGNKEQWEAMKLGSDWRNCAPAESVQCADAAVELPQFDIKDGTLGKYYGAASSVSIPEGVTEIGNNAFDGCKPLVSISIPGSVTKIGNYAFKDCTALSSISIPESVTEIGWNVFYGCTSLVSVSIPASVTKISNDMFGSCTSLASVGIPDSVTSIGDGAFDGCTPLASLVIPESVTKIGEKAFCSCTSLASINIPDGVTKIGWGTFSDCTSLASVSIPEGVTEIDHHAFSRCTSLVSVSIPDSVTEIGEKAFDGCTSLAEIHYAGSKEQWYAVQKGDAWNKDVPAKDVLVRKQ